MRNFLMLIAFVTCSIVTMDAQIKMGLRTAIGTNVVSEEETFILASGDVIDYQLTVMDASPTKSIGIYTQAKFGYLFLQPEVLYSTYTTSFDLKSFSDNIAGNGINKQTNQNIDVHVMAGITKNGFRLGVGPVFHFNGNKVNDLTVLDNFELKARPLSMGFTTGIGYDFGVFHLDAKYERNFSAVGEELYFNGRSAGLKGSIQNFSIGLGIAL